MNKCCDIIFRYIIKIANCYQFFRDVCQTKKISLRFLDSFDNHQVRCNTYATLQLSEEPLVGFFDVFVIRRDAPQFPLHSQDTKVPPFVIYGCESVIPVSYTCTGFTHYGFRIYVNNVTTIIVHFLQLGTYRTATEIQSGLKVDKAKVWNFIVSDSTSGQIFDLLPITVVQRLRIRQLPGTVDQRHFVGSVAEAIRGWTPEMMNLCLIFMHILNHAMHVSQNN